ncbi:hypothetical protein ACHAPJ_012701 [Fusarium lateritium]
METSAVDDGSRSWTGANGEEQLPTASRRRDTAHGIDDGIYGHKKRLSQNDYTFGWICALSIEMAAARAMLDNIHESLPTSPVDTNAYTFGSIGKHNVVIACLPSYGLNNAATVANNLRRSFPSASLAVMVGIGGGVPGKVDMRLGDVVVSTEVVQYDFGKTIAHGHFQRTGTLNKPPQALMTAVAKLQADHRTEPSTSIPSILSKMLERYPAMIDFTHPGILQDQLFDGKYDHPQHFNNCESCDASRLVSRPARDNTNPRIHCGIIASGNQVMKHGRTRDQLAKELDVLCFEMEAAGLMDSLPCLVVRGICDYADSHKNKRWQEYSAATAAAYVKELLSIIPMNNINQTEGGAMLSNTGKHEWMVPFERNEDFVGRQDVLRLLRDRLPPDAKKDVCQRTIIEGLGGVGKTQIALEAAYRFHDTDPSCWVFWVPAMDMTTFENAYRSIGRLLNVTGINDDKAEVKTLVQSALSHEDVGPWLLIVDNADDPELMFGLGGLAYYLPRSIKGSILFTTRTRETTKRLDIHAAGIIKATKMTTEEAREMLQARLTENQVRDGASTDGLLEFLDNLPLAVRQASAHMLKTGISTTRYLEYCRSSDATLVKLLSRDFEDRGRYDGIKNPVATTWLISFRHILRDHSLAGEYLRFMCFLAERNIPVSLLPPNDDEMEVDEAIGTLEAYGFVTRREEGGYLDIHRLVRLTMWNWLQQEGQARQTYCDVVHRLCEVFPYPQHESRGTWMEYMAHAQRVVESEEECDDDKAMSRLLVCVAQALHLQGRYEGAVKLEREALKLRVDVLGSENEEILAISNNLALDLLEIRQYQEAHNMFRETLELREKVRGKEHPDTIMVMHNLAHLLGSMRHDDEAEKMYREVLELRVKVLGKKHPDTVNSMNGFASVLISRGKYEEAEMIYRQVLEFRKRILRTEHPDILRSENGLALSLHALGQYEEAEKIYREVSELFKKVFGKKHPDTLRSTYGLANILNSRGKYGEAEMTHREILELRQKIIGTEHPDTLVSMNGLARSIYGLGQYEEAETMHRKVSDLTKKILGMEHPDTLSSMHNLARSLEALGRYQKAEGIYRETLKLREKVLGKEHPVTLMTRNRLLAMLGNKC